MVANAVRCVPPQNKPTPAEINTCRQFLSPLFGSEFRWRAIIALGRIAHDSVVRAFGGKLSQFPFAHAGEHRLETPNGPRALFDSYHCSRYNTNTGVLTPEMFRAVFESVRRHLARA
jgi:uracil-DNA glycosylase family 4